MKYLSNKSYIGDDFLRYCCVHHITGGGSLSTGSFHFCNMLAFDAVCWWAGSSTRIVMEFEKNVDKKRGKKARNYKLSDKRKQSSYRFSSELNLTG